MPKTSKICSQIGYFELILAQFCRLFASAVLDAILDTYGEVRRQRAGPTTALSGWTLESSGRAFSTANIISWMMRRILRASPPAAGPHLLMTD